ncbi:YaiO family outer membrane beta-barrel protein [Niabella drilacis]|uniref:Outer membrane protein, YaiO family n=1 Tax=Niabella drilacis (strain DSM 25811 / CCM 8410 / CCUG 62505 / LMG 26954 / E90) TaxID=1285928 RepID=A0A1G6Z132_NIADE|nr:YaiO family outer membrane beta-barrel protein [Niabella drilacis]SDD96454.1 outer membrane protein, YaiO family [Niabella drilacis]
MSIRAPLLWILLFAGLQVCAQADTTTSDGLFQAARHAAFEKKDYVLAEHYAVKALGLSPKYADVRVFLGRLYTWQKRPDSARACFNYILNDEPDYEDAAVAYTDLEYWNDNNAAALERANAGLQYHPASAALLLRKAKVLAAMRHYGEAGNIVDTLLKKNSKNAEALALGNSIRDERSLNRVGISYDYVYFDKQFDDPWHLVSLDYGRRTGIGTVIGRVNYANRFRDNGVQLEVDAYPRISRTFYLYVNGGYSNNVGVFPRWRAGLSVYANLPRSFEAELGIRHLYFTSATNIYTAYIGKYYSSFLFGARAYFVPSKTSRNSVSYNLLGRYYFGGADDFIGLNLGTGVSPDERYLSPQLNAAYPLKTYKASLDFRHAFKLNIVTLGASLINQEYMPDTKGNQIQAGVGYIRRF